MQLLETIRYEAGQLVNISYHNQRLNRSRQELFGQPDPWDLEELIVSIPDHVRPDQRYRCRVLYSEHGIDVVEFIPYSIRPVQSLKLVQADDLNYAYKYADRTELITLAKGSSADEIILVKNGLLTDTTYTNLALFDGNEWYTPHKPLLAGTHRAALLATRRIIPERLSADDLKYFQKIRLFNAMMNWEESPTLPISAIR
ncbi:MAG: aminotransferase class IV [Siphonobacter sp.]